MRRPRQHRLTGSVRRLLGAAMLAAMATVLAVTIAARPASAAGPGANLNLGALDGINLNLPTGLPVTVPTGSAPTTSAPTLPSASLPVCRTSCVASGPGAGGGPAGQHSPGGNTGSATGHAAPVGFGGSVPGAAAPRTSPVTSTLSVPHAAAGLAVSPPPPVEPLTPLAGISFGQAPYLWPLLVLLDVAALAAVVTLVRRTWSPKSDAG